MPYSTKIRIRHLLRKYASINWVYCCPYLAPANQVPLRCNLSAAAREGVAAPIIRSYVLPLQQCKSSGLFVRYQSSLLATGDVSPAPLVRFPGGSSGGEGELALVQRRKVRLPLGEPQINDRGCRLSAGLHASCPIHRQTCQGVLPPGVLGIFTELFHHFLPPAHWLTWRKDGGGQNEWGAGVPVSGLLKPGWATPYLGHLP